MDVIALRSAPARLDRRQIELRLQNCARLPSLARINHVLRALLDAEERYTAQISEVIRRDPSMTTRLLRLVNSAYYGLTAAVSSVEEAVFYLGLRQIRELAAVTPLVEDLQRLAGAAPFPWRRFWQHCIATAILTQELRSSRRIHPGEEDYIAGLLHDVGRIVLISLFPEHFAEIERVLSESPCDPLPLEAEVLGLDHCDVGALYLTKQGLPTILVEAARFHHQPELARQHAGTVAAVQVADLLARHAQIGSSGNPTSVTEEDWRGAAGWHILFPEPAAEEKALAQDHLERSLARLPAMLEALI